MLMHGCDMWSYLNLFGYCSFLGGRKVGDNKCFLQIAYNRADLGVTSFACSPDYLGYLECSTAIYSQLTYWINRAPRELSPATNLLRIFTPLCWILILGCIASIIAFLILSSRFGHYCGLKIEHCEIPLIPLE